MSKPAGRSLSHSRVFGQIVVWIPPLAKLSRICEIHATLSNKLKWLLVNFKITSLFPTLLESAIAIKAPSIPFQIPFLSLSLFRAVFLDSAVHRHLSDEGRTRASNRARPCHLWRLIKYQRIAHTGCTVWSIWCPIGKVSLGIPQKNLTVRQVPRYIYGQKYQIKRKGMEREREREEDKKWKVANTGQRKEIPTKTPPGRLETNKTSLAYRVVKKKCLPVWMFLPQCGQITWTANSQPIG